MRRILLALGLWCVVPCVAQEPAHMPGPRAPFAPDATVHGWAPMGTGLYTDNIMAGIFQKERQPTTYEVEVERDTLNAGYFRIVNPYGPSSNYRGQGNYDGVDTTLTRYLTINAVDPEYSYVELSPLGIGLNGEEFTVWSFAELYKGQGYQAGKYDQGIITDQKALSMWLETPSSAPKNQGFYTNNGGKFRLVLPGATPHFYVDHGHQLCFDNNLATVPFERIGEFTHFTVLPVLRQEFVNDAEHLAQYAEASYAPTAVTEGSVTVDISELPAEKPVELVIFGWYDAADGSGERYYVQRTPLWTLPDDTGWSKLPQRGRYTETFVAMFQNLSLLAPVTYDVDLYTNPDYPGLVRVLNPYSRGVYPRYVKAHSHGTGHNHYLTFDISDPRNVVLRESPIGYRELASEPKAHVGDHVVAGVGQLLLNNGYTWEQVRGMNECGRLDSLGVITFPRSRTVTIGATGTRSTSDEISMYYTNCTISQYGRNQDRNGEFALALGNGYAAIVDPEIDSASVPLQYYDLQGRPLAAAPATPGIYILRQGATTRKVRIQ